MSNDFMERREFTPSFTLVIASREDWELFKDFRLEVASSEDAPNYDETVFISDSLKDDSDWQNLLNSPDFFVVFVRDEASKVVGFTTAKLQNSGTGSWLVTFSYIKPEFRGKGFGIGKKLLAFRLQEILKREGKKVFAVFRENNTKTKIIFEYFGFKETKKTKDGWVTFFISITKDNTILTAKINEILNAK